MCGAWAKKAFSPLCLSVEKPQAVEKKHLALVGAALTVVLGVWLRYLPEQGMQYLQALDPYFIYSMSQHLVFEGQLPVTDFTRYFPYNYPAYRAQVGDIAIPALMYLAGPQFFMPFLEWAQLYPVVMAGFAIFAMFLLGREYAGNVGGVSAAFFVATIAGSMQRTSAGFFEKEPTAIPFMILSVFTFARAWRNEDWRFGLASGLCLGVSTISWGGSKFLWLLFPLAVAPVVIIDRDIQGILRAYTPAILVGGVMGAVVDPGRFSLASDLFVANLLGVLFVWSRYLVEYYEIIPEKRLSYYAPVSALAGLVLTLLSPLYSDYVAGLFFGLLKKVSQTTGGTIAGTVAENQAASLNQFAGQLSASGAGSAASLLPGSLPGVGSLLSIFGSIAGPLPLAYISIVFMGASLAAMLASRLGAVEGVIPEVSYHQIAAVVLLVWTFTFALFFQSGAIFAAGPSLLLTVAASAFLYFSGEIGSNFEVEQDYSLSLALFFVVSVVLGAASKSRLLFLASFPVSFGAGYTVSLAWNRVKMLSRGSQNVLAYVFGVVLLDVVVVGLALGQDVNLLLVGLGLAVTNLGLYIVLDPDKVRSMPRKPSVGFVAGAAVVVLFSVNLASGFSAVSNAGGSPNQLWEENLDYQRTELESGDVVLSWWDYGYWFENIGERAAVADGSNAGYYTSIPQTNKTNYPIADMLTSSNHSQHRDLLDKHGVDYIVLDQTMIGKYSAVSQISNRDNSEFQSMLQVGTGSARSSLSGDANSSVLTLSGRGINVYTPVDISGSGVSISGAPTLETRRGRTQIGCVLTEEGEKEFNVTQESRFSPRTRSTASTGASAPTVEQGWYWFRKA